VFSCSNQDQDLDRVDFANLRGRLIQNGVQEKLTKLWIDRSLRQLELRNSSLGSAPGDSKTTELHSPT